MLGMRVNGEAQRLRMSVVLELLACFAAAADQTSFVGEIGVSGSVQITQWLSWLSWLSWRRGRRGWNCSGVCVLPANGAAKVSSLWAEAAQGSSSVRRPPSPTRSGVPLSRLPIDSMRSRECGVVPS